MNNDRRIVELTTLNQISATLNEAVDLESALRSSLEQLVRLMDLTTGWIFILDQSTPGEPARLVHTADFQLPPALAADDAARLKPAGCSCQDLFTSGKFKKSVNIVECSRIEDALEASGDVGGLRIHASVPIRARDRVIGILNVASPAIHHFNEEDLQLMTAVGNQIGLAAERARLFDLTRIQRVNGQAALLKLSNASVGWDLSKFGGDMPHFTEKAPAGLAYFSGQTVRVDDLETDPRADYTDAYKRMGFRSALAVPVVHYFVLRRARSHSGDPALRQRRPQPAADGTGRIRSGVLTARARHRAVYHAPDPADGVRSAVRCGRRVADVHRRRDRRVERPH